MAAEKSMGVKLTKITAPSSVIADLTSIGEIGLESTEIDVTTLDSLNNYKEYIAGSKDAGEVSLAGFIKSEANMDEMLILAESQAVVQWEIEFPATGSAWTFSGFVKMWKEGESTIDGVRNFTGSIRISGKPEYYPAGASI